jgi:hypothetical protein
VSVLLAVVLWRVLTKIKVMVFTIGFFIFAFSAFSVALNLAVVEFRHGYSPEISGLGLVNVLNEG